MNVIKKLFFLLAIAGIIGNITHASNHTNIYVWNNFKYRFTMIRPAGAFGKQKTYHNNTIIVRKELSGKVSANTVEKLLYKTMNAFITQCPNFDIIEHGANKENKSLCNNPEIIKAYEEFKKQYQKK